MALTSGILPVFEQLGIYDEFKTISLPCKSLKLLNGDMEKIIEVPTMDEKLIGYDHRLLSRPRLYAFLQSKVPAEKVHFSKKFVSSEDTEEGVTVHFADGTKVQGDILVGADGAYSSVRKSLLKILKDQGMLPADDDTELSVGYSCLVGTTNPVDPDVYSLVKNKHTNQLQVIGEGTPYSYTVFNVADNCLCYVVICQLMTVGQVESEKFSGRHWGNERCEEMIEKVKDFKSPCGGTLGDLFELTPPEKISKVYLHDKLFETWTHNRTVLLGDSAHKLLPSAGKGAVCAMQDSVVLVNCLYELESLKTEAIKTALEEYRQQRYPRVKEQYENTPSNAIFLHGQTIFEKSLRYSVFNWVPDSLMSRKLLKDAYRPQLSFLKLAPKRGTGKVLAQKPSKRYEEERKRNSGEESITRI
ncbi:hypothetical protein BGZ83_005311 [Gryganskiella cystojenkinii]|nr:hypothetical protein BGZ83_005311 [Gryganskiella cystojenkinii]